MFIKYSKVRFRFAKTYKLLRGEQARQAQEF